MLCPEQEARSNFVVSYCLPFKPLKPNDFIAFSFMCEWAFFFNNNCFKINPSRKDNLDLPLESGSFVTALCSGAASRARVCCCLSQQQPAPLVQGGTAACWEL